MSFSEFDKEKIKDNLRGILSNAQELERWISEECKEADHPALHNIDDIRRATLRAGEKLDYTSRELTEVRF